MTPSAHLNEAGVLPDPPIPRRGDGRLGPRGAGGERRMNEPEKIWLLWRDGQGTTDRLVASEIDHSDEGFPEYVRVDLLDAANAKIKRLRALLREGE